MNDPRDLTKPQPTEDDTLSHDDAVDYIAGRFQVPRGVYTRMVRQESGGRDDAVSPLGARGRFQVMPDTLAGIAKQTGKQLDPDNPLHNAYAGLKLLSDNYKRFKPKARSERHAWMMAVAGYHGNPDNVDRDLDAGGIGIPDQGDGGINTIDHVYNIFKGTTDEDFKLPNGAPINKAASSDDGAQPPATEGQPQQQPAQIAPEDEEVERFDSQKIDPKKPIQEAGIKFEAEDGSGLNLGTRAALRAAQLEQGAPPADDPDTIGEARTVKVRAPKGRYPTADELNDAVLASYGPEYLATGQKYRQETGRNIAVSQNAIAELIQRGKYDEAAGEHAIPVRPQKSLVRVLEAYKEGGLEAAQEAAREIARKRTEIDQQQANTPKLPRTLMDDVVTGLRKGAAANAKLVSNAADLAEGVYKEIRYGQQSEEFKDYEREKEENREITDAALDSMPKGEGVTGKLAQGLGSVVPQLPTIAAAGLKAQPLLGTLQSLDKGNVEALKQGVISGASVGGAKAAGHLAKELSPLASNLTQRAAGGATNVAASAATGERDPEQLAADFAQGAAMPVGKSRRVMHERLGELTITGPRNDGRLDAVDADGKPHVIQNPRKGNQQATFIKQEAAENSAPQANPTGSELTPQLNLTAKQQAAATPVEQAAPAEPAAPSSLVGRRFRNNETGRVITITKENEKGVTVSYEVEGRTQRVGITKGFLAGKFTEQPSGAAGKGEAIAPPVKPQEDGVISVAPSKKTKHDYSSTQVTLPGGISDKVISASKQIKDGDLADVDWEARENKPHITVKFGLHDDNADEVRRVLADEVPFKVKLGKTSIFPAKEGADYDVVKVDVDSPELHRLNRKLADALPHDSTHPTYKPHVTLAYVKPGKGEEYADRSDLEGQEITFDRIAFSDKTGQQVEIPLQGTGAKNRSFPKALEDVGLPGGADRKYTPTTNAEALRRAAQTIKTKGVDGAIDYIRETATPSAEHTATGISLIGQLQREAEAIKSARPEEAEGKYARAVEVASELSRKLTESGQAIQAASIVSRLSPDGITLFAQRQIAKQSPGARVTPELAQTLVAAAKKVTTADAGSERAGRIAALAEKAKAEGKLEADERAEIRDYIKELQGAVGGNQSRQSMTQLLKVRLDAVAQAAQVRLKERGYRLNAGIPADSIADFAVIYAARAARGGIKATEWAAQMAKDYGADVKPHLRRIEREALKLLNTERARARAVYSDTRTMAAILSKIETVKVVDATQAKTLGDLAASLKTLTGVARVEAAQELQGALQALDRPGLLRKISTAQTIAQLANPKTIGRNVVGNELFYRLERANKYPATAIDFARSKLTGTERQITFRTAGQGDYWRNFIRGVRAGAKGVNPLGIQSQYDFSGPAFRSKINPLLYLERGLKASIQGFDFAAYMRARNQTLAELGVLKAQREGVPAARRREYVKKFIDEADAASVEIAHNYGKFVTFQDDNIISNALGGLKKGLNFGQDFGVGDFVLKYPRTPGALIMRGIDYSPAGILRGIYLLKPFIGKGATLDTREGQQAISRAITGTLGTTALGYFLRDAGVLTGEDEKDRDVEAFLREQTGEGKFKVNVSAVRRWLMGGFRPADLAKRQGDMLASYDWMQPIAMSLSIGAKINESLNRKKDAPEGVMPVAYDAVKSGLNTVAEQPVIKNVRELFDGSNQKEGIVGGLENAAEGVPASFIPTFLNQIRQYTDNQARVTYDANPAHRALNRAVAKLPLVSSALPAAHTTLGKPKETYRDGTNGFFNVFLNPAFVEKYTIDPQIEMVLRPYEAEGRKEQFPRVAPKKIKHDGKDYELSGAELSRLQKEMGEQTAARFNKLDSAKLAGRTPEEQEKELAEEVSGAWEQAKNNLLQKRGADLYAGYRRELASKGLKPEQIDHNVRVRGEVAELHERVKADASISDEGKKKLTRFISDQLGPGRVKIKDEERTLDKIKQEFQDAMEAIEEDLKDKIEEVKEEDDK